jgi:hypothetical protein
MQKETINSEKFKEKTLAQWENQFGELGISQR